MTRQTTLDAADEGLLDVATRGDLIKQGGVHGLRVGLAGELKQSAFRRIDQRRPSGLDHQSKTQDLRGSFAVVVTGSVGDHQRQFALAVSIEEIAHDVFRSDVETRCPKRLHCRRRPGCSGG